MEAAHDSLAREVSSLSDTIQRVELNQQHAYELNDLRFKSLDVAVGTIGTKLDAFMGRIEGIITGEVQTAQAKNGERLVEDYYEWRKSVDARIPDPNEVTEYRQWRKDVDTRMDQQDVLSTQVRFLGKLVIFATSGGVIAIITAVAALLSR